MYSWDKKKKFVLTHIGCIVPMTDCYCNSCPIHQLCSRMINFVENPFGRKPSGHNEHNSRQFLGAQ